MTFDWVDFLAALDPWAIVALFIVGLGFGLAFRLYGLLPPAHHVYWMASSALVFFVPLAILRGLHGATSWERLLGTGITWLVWMVGMHIGGRLPRR